MATATPGERARGLLDDSISSTTLAQSILVDECRGSDVAADTAGSLTVALELLKAARSKLELGA